MTKNEHFSDTDMYIVLARKYRPQKFSEVIGQKIIVNGLQQAIKENKIPHAFLFSGPKGSGKTSIARILAKSLNCEKSPLSEPCDKCEFCKEIISGNSLDFLEIDGASNRGIDEIRNLRENVLLMPAKSRFKIYLIDEVHMLTTEAFNALLKTLEEPPSYVKFIFATTSPEKIPQTISSRCQKYQFKPLKMQEIAEKINLILKNEGYTIDPQALEKIILISSGSLRDALGYLDQLIILSQNKNITIELTNEALGIIETKSIWKMIGFLCSGQVYKALEFFHNFIEQGKELIGFLDGLNQNLRLLLLKKPNFSGSDILIDIDNKEYIEKILLLSFEQILKSIETVLEIKEKIKYEPMEIIYGEILIIKLSKILNISSDNSGNIVYETQQIKSEEKKEILEKKQDKIYQESYINQESKSNISEENWKKFLNEIKKKKIALEAFLRAGKPVKIENNCLYIGFPEKMKFHCSMAQDKDNMKYAEEILEKILGFHYNISYFLFKEEPKNTQGPSSSIKKIVDCFEGEIIETEE
jgi:DNA polymerase-3 subunit gamma/tau